MMMMGIGEVKEARQGNERSREANAQNWRDTYQVSWRNGSTPEGGNERKPGGRRGRWRLGLLGESAEGDGSGRRAGFSAAQAATVARGARGWCSGSHG